MSGDIDNISFHLGQINSRLAAIETNTATTKADVIEVSKRVKAIEMKSAYERGGAAQKTKILAAFGIFFGGVGGAVATWILKHFP